MPMSVSINVPASRSYKFIEKFGKIAKIVRHVVQHIAEDAAEHLRNIRASVMQQRT